MTKLAVVVALLAPFALGCSSKSKVEKACAHIHDITIDAYENHVEELEAALGKDRVAELKEMAVDNADTDFEVCVRTMTKREAKGEADPDCFLAADTLDDVARCADRSDKRKGRRTR